MQELTCFGVFFVSFKAFKCLGVVLFPVVLLKYIRIYLHMHVGNSKEPRGMRIGNDCVVPLDGPARCNGRRVDVVWLDGYYVVGDWLCEESGVCVKVPVLRVALDRIRRRRGVVRARLY